MRITKRQLRRIIKEERRNLLERGDMNARGPDEYVDYVMWPEEYVDSAAKDLLTPEEVESIGGMQKLEVLAIDLADELAYKLEDSEEGFGSSDRAAELKGYIDQLGFKTDWNGPGGSLQVIREGKVGVIKRKINRLLKEQGGSGSEGAYQDAVSVAKEAYYELDEIMQEWENTPDMNSAPGSGTPDDFKQRIYSVMDNILNKDQQF
jgi:hypothetical protein